MASNSTGSDKFAGKVRVYHLDNKGTKSFVGMYDEQRLISISTMARQILHTQDGTPKVMSVQGVDIDQLNYVITAAIHYGKRLRLKVNEKSMPEVILVLDVVETLGIVPSQPQVEGQLVHLLAHTPITPWAMVNIHEIYGARGNRSKVWRVMLHQIAWNIAHEQLTEQEVEALNAAGKRFRELDQAMKEKIAHLKGCVEHSEAKKMKAGAETGERESTHSRQGRKHNRGASKSPSNESAKHKLSYREKVQQKREEENFGLREASEGTVDYLKHRRPTGFWVTPKMSQKNRKIAQRNQAESANETGPVAREQSGESEDSAEGVEIAL